MDNETFLNTKQIAVYLGESVGTIYHWVAQRKIPHYKRGKELRFKLSEIKEWDEERNRRPARYELAESL